MSPAREAALSRHGDPHELRQCGSVRRMLYREVEGEGRGGAGEVGDPAPAFRDSSEETCAYSEEAGFSGKEQADSGAGKGPEGR